jgi:ferredoxin
MAFPRLAPADVRVEGIAHPRLSPVGDFLAPRAFIRLTRRLLEVRPTVEKKKCIGCGFCQAQCPAKAILMAAAGRDGKRARILYNLCIHCYCCQEICPEGAISPKRGLVRRLFARPVSPPA